MLLGDEVMRLAPVDDALVQPRAWRERWLVALVAAAASAAESVLFGTHWVIGGICLAWLAYPIATRLRRSRVGVTVEASRVLHGATRIDLGAATISQLAWVAGAGRIGTVLSIARGRDAIRVGVRADTTPCNEASDEVDVVLAPDDYVRLRARVALQRAVSIPTYRDASPSDALRVLFASPIQARGGLASIGWAMLATFLVAFFRGVLSPTIGDVLWGLVVAAVAMREIVWRPRHRRRRKIRVDGSALVWELEGVDPRRYPDARSTTLRVGVGQALGLEVRHPDGSRLEITSLPSDPAAVVLAPDDLAALAGWLAPDPGVPRTRVAEDVGDEQEAELSPTSRRRTS